MIHCTLAQLSRNKRGESIRQELLLSSADLRIGRGADCRIHLSDPRVKLHAAVIHPGEHGGLYLEAPDRTLIIDGELEQRARLKPGLRALIGPYQLGVERCDDATSELTLTVELMEPLPDMLADVQRRTRTSLEALGLSKRLPAVSLFLLILGLFLLLPILSATQPALRESTSKLPVAPDESWNPGPLAHPHQGFGRDCKRCHDQPFVQVRDATCEACHKTIGGHLSNAALQASAMGQARCAECHRDHKGLNALVRHDTTLCTTCHADVKTQAPKTTLANIRDFASDHPHFKLAMMGQDGKVTRILQSDKANLKEQSGLLFPHDVHLNRKGVKSPKGKVVMECSGCHKPDAAGVRFEPVSMEKHCADCHRLEFEPAITTRTVPHADPKVVLTTLREFYAAIAIGETPIDVTTVDGLLRRSNEANSEVARKRAMAWANEKAQSVAADLIEDRVCATCHQISKTGNDWTVAPVRITQYWMVKAKFEHHAHKTAKCSDCHDVARSKHSDDIAIPDIDSCRTCHAGAEPQRNKVTSTCESCHGFHVGSPKRGLSSAQLSAFHSPSAVPAKP